jgi:hypothetical protein
MVPSIWSAVEALVCRTAEPEAASWLGDARRLAERSAEAFHRAWSAAGRRLGRAPLAFASSEIQALGADGASLARQSWAMDEAGRGVLLGAVSSGLAPADHPRLVEELYRTGEVRERQALLKALPFLPDPSRFVSVAVEAVRSSALAVLEAIACDNPYPAAFFPEPAFNQMVLKALFNEIPLRRVVGLGERRGEELARMVRAYASERRAAGRPVPPDAALATGEPHA